MKEFFTRKCNCMGVIVAFILVIASPLYADYNHIFDAGVIAGTRVQSGIRYSLQVPIFRLTPTPPPGTTYDTTKGVTEGTPPEGFDISFNNDCTIVTGTVEYGLDTIPTSSFPISMHGKLKPPLGGAGAGTQPTWGASGQATPFYIKSSENHGDKVIVVPVGRTVTYTAFEGTNEKPSNWTVKNKTKENVSNITFTSSWWNILEWYRAEMDTPDPGIYNIGATASNNSNLFDNDGIMTVVGAQFEQGVCAGFDNFTNWSKGASDYYTINRKGYCTKYYISVKNGDNGTSNLELTPTPISESINITENSSNIENLSPCETMSSTNISFKGISGEGDISVTFKGTTLVSAVVCAYEEKTINVLIVKVNEASSAADYNVAKIMRKSLIDMEQQHATLVQCFVTKQKQNAGAVVHELQYTMSSGNASLSGEKEDCRKSCG